jgi:glycosyltransferase involved in cell wall biosynthesis
VHSFFTASDLLGGLVAKLSGPRILVSSRRDMGFQRSALQHGAYRLMGSLFDQVHAVSESVRVWHMQHDHLPPEKIVKLYNGVDLQEIDAAVSRPLSEVGVVSAAQVVVTVANVRPVKALEVLVATAAIVCREAPGTRFLILGFVQDEAYMKCVQELAHNLQVADKLVFAGNVGEVVGLLRSCEVFFLPSHSEGMSNAMLEAMACSLPCVATAVGGNPELITHGENGYLVPPRDPQAAAGRILELLADPAHAARMGRASRQLVETRFNLQAMMDRLVELYEGLLERRGYSRTTARNNAGPRPGVLSECTPAASRGSARWQRDAVSPEAN